MTDVEASARDVRDGIGRGIREAALAALEKQDTPGGAMVALYPSPDEAAALAVAGGQAAADIHLTLAYLGPATDVPDADALRAAVARCASWSKPLAGSVSGAGTFADTPDGPVTIALPAVNGLYALADSVRWAAREADCAVGSDYPFYPHLTLVSGRGEAVRAEAVAGTPLTFGAVSVVVGPERTDFPLRGHDGPCDELCEHPSEMAMGKALAYSVHKADVEKRRTTGVLYVPDATDAHDEWATEEDLDDAVANYVKKGDLNLRLMHDPDVVCGSMVGIISWPYEAEVQLTDQATGDVRTAVLPAGTVYATAEWDAAIWPAVKDGRIGGFSLGGRTIRVYDAAPDGALPAMAEL